MVFVAILEAQVCRSESCERVAVGHRAGILATAEPLQKDRLGDRGQMVVMVFEPKLMPHLRSKCLSW